jgi:hypothetical protein
VEDRQMILKIARFINLVLAGVFTGNEFGGFIGFHPALYELPTEVGTRLCLLAHLACPARPHLVTL